MKASFAAAMRRAARATRANDLAGAMQIIREAVGAGGGHAERAGSSSGASPTSDLPRRLDHASLGKATAQPKRDDNKGPAASAQSLDADQGPNRTARVRRPLRDVLSALKHGRPQLDARLSPAINLPGVNLAGLSRSSPPPVPPGAHFLTRTFVGDAGSRAYKLYIPGAGAPGARGLIVMLHGCNQNPDDFANGTNMNALGEAHGMLVAYPSQPASANASSCWNWFNPADQRRNAGEPSIIAGITREIMSEFHLERNQVFVAGLSAGGAMAAIMAETYPDLYSAVGIHSGLAYGSADDVVSAFATMRGDRPPLKRRGSSSERPRVRTIVFQGSADAVVHPSNAEHIVSAAAPVGTDFPRRQDRVHAPGRRAATRTVVSDPAGPPLIEYWVVEGAGHAWAGGSTSGSFTDATGPDASSEMIRFFLGNARNS